MLQINVEQYFPQTRRSHDRIWQKPVIQQKVLFCFRENGKITEVDFFGETYTTDGCKPAQNKVSAIVEMPALTCKKQVQSFIGMVNYLAKYSVRLSELAEPIRELSKDKVPFNWGP